MRKVARRSRDECVTSLREVREILPAAKYSRAPVPNVRAKAQKQALPTSRSLAILAMYDVLFLFLQKRKSTKKKENLRAYALKNPLIVQTCYAQSKTVCAQLPQLQFAPSEAFPLGKGLGTHQSFMST